jgi:hypothetical protein
MKVTIVANLRLRKSRPYGNCHILTGILGIFKPITALKSPWKNSTLHCIKLDYYIRRWLRKLSMKLAPWWKRVKKFFAPKMTFSENISRRRHPSVRPSPSVRRHPSVRPSFTRPSVSAFYPNPRRCTVFSGKLAMATGHAMLINLHLFE